ncbi:AfsR/SARP family transcriptional regulator (plasmid) [Streptomyces sp. FXJ1.172]|uniref:AfsR/SARP family transcriptional regulator n=1 Tax=Streptomyces sp. FXJ1.172 TaxID=710705 RepID=UPI0023DD64B6|nr:AfsR/SARP family transcriptional regulator [Streptomyces sp. FXJ1.172]WEP01117.1 AfsR/SARP family transcriptional regulator [Streptomyces sp. FXJ1.172]
MNIEVLGALDVRENGVRVTPTAPKPRQVLALLALQADHVVSVAALSEELWGSTPPRSARTTLQTYVLQLRELIAEALERDPKGPVQDAGAPRTAKDVLVTVQGGYVLRSGGGTSDVREFERLTALGYEAMDAGDFRSAARQLRQALGLWTGPAFADVQAGEQLRTETRRLEEARLCALDRRIEAELRLGRHRDLLAELTVLVGRYPTHETLRGQYMLALHRSGRRSEALETYQLLRATLVRELGLEPSVDLRRIQRQILAAGPDDPLDGRSDGDGDRLMPSV